MSKSITNQLEQVIEALKEFDWYAKNIEAKLTRRLRWEKWQVNICLDVLEELGIIRTDKCRCGETKITILVGSKCND